MYLNELFEIDHNNFERSFVNCRSSVVRIPVRLVLLGLMVFAAVAVNQHAESTEDNDFAEFEDADYGRHMSTVVIGLAA